VTLEVECIDRKYLNAYVPRLQRDVGVVVMFVRSHRGERVASSVLMGCQETSTFARLETSTFTHRFDSVRRF
jgi:hypothetical protein